MHKKRLILMVISLLLLIPVTGLWAEAQLVCHDSSTPETTLRYTSQSEYEKSIADFNAQILAYLNHSGTAAGLADALEHAAHDDDYNWMTELVETDITGD